MTFNALKEKGLPLEKQLRNWHLIVREPYNKTEIDSQIQRRNQWLPAGSGGREGQRRGKGLRGMNYYV